MGKISASYIKSPLNYNNNNKQQLRDDMQMILA
jgi:hypothetical protein